MVEFPETLKLSHVPRWAIIDMRRVQTVSDHVYRTMIIAEVLVSRLGVDIDVSMLMWRILHHDADEARTGDIPSTAKHHHAILDGSSDGDIILKLADTIEAYTWAQRYAVKPDKIMVSVFSQMDVCITFLKTRYFNVRRVVNEVVHEITSYS